MVVSGTDSEVAIRPGIAVFSKVAPGLEIGLRFAIDCYGRSSRGGKLERAIGGQPCRFLRSFPANPTPASFRRSSTPNGVGKILRPLFFGAGSSAAKRQAKN